MAEILTLAEANRKKSTISKKEFVMRLLRRGVKLDEAEIALFRESYKGGKAYISVKNLFTHVRERTEEFNDRLKRAYYLNYCSPIIDTYTFFLFKASVLRTYDSKDIKLAKFINDCNRKGLGLDAYMKDLTISLLQSGTEFIVVDAPSERAETKAEELEKNLSTYIYSLKVEDVLDYEEDDDGLVWIKFKALREKKGSWDYEGTGEETLIIIWTRSDYKEYSEKGELLKEEKNEQGIVPVIKVTFGSGESIIKDIALINRSIFNWCSLLDELLYRQTFSWLVMPGDSAETLEDKELGSSFAFTFPSDAKHIPSFISPDTSQGTLIGEQIKTAVGEIYRMANLDWSQAQTVNQSGVAKAYDFMNVNKTLSSIAYSLQEAEKKIFKIRASFYARDGKTEELESKGESPITIQYPTDFAFTAIMEKLQQLYDALSTTFSVTFKKRVAERIVDTIFPALPEEDKKAIKTEIEESFDLELLQSLEMGNLNEEPAQEPAQ